MNCAIGLDIGGTNIKGLAVTPEGKVLAEVVLPTGGPGGEKQRCYNSPSPQPSPPGRGRIVVRPLTNWDQRSSTRSGVPKLEWTENVRRAVRQLQRAGHRSVTWIGIAAPGLPAKDQRSIAFMPGRLPGLEGLIWEEFLKVPHPVPVLNDAQAALLGEVWRGAACRSTNALLLTLGTGVGGAAMVDGRLLRGHLGRAGHFGHVSLSPTGPLDIVNAPGSLEDAIGDCTVRKRSDGRFGSTLALVAAARRGDAQARRVWLASVQALAAAIASLINVLDPERVILGGGIAQAGAALLRPLKGFLDQFEWRPGGARVRIVQAQLAERAGAFGAAWNAMHFNPESPRVTKDWGGDGSSPGRNRKAETSGDEPSPPPRLPLFEPTLHDTSA
jgi:glucokinase